MVKKQKKTIFTQSSVSRVKVSKHPLAQPEPKYLRLGNAVRPAIVKSRFVKFPRYVRLQRQKRILMRRLKTPPAVAQFFSPLDKDTAGKIFRLLRSEYSRETKREKRERIRKEAGEEEKKKKEETPIPLKFGLNHVTYLIEQKLAKLVLIAADVDPIETVVFLPSLCKTMDVPYAIVPSKSRLGALVNQKTATCVALTCFPRKSAEMESFCKLFREKFNGPPAHSLKPEKGYKGKVREGKGEKKAEGKK